MSGRVEWILPPSCLSSRSSERGFLEPCRRLLHVGAFRINFSPRPTDRNFFHFLSRDSSHVSSVMRFGIFNKVPRSQRDIQESYVRTIKCFLFRNFLEKSSLLVGRMKFLGPYVHVIRVYSLPALGLVINRLLRKSFLSCVDRKLQLAISRFCCLI